MRRLWVLAFVVIQASPLWALAAEVGAEAEFPLEIHGFVSQGAIKTTSNNYLVESERGSFEFSEAGINVTKGLTDRLRCGLQLFARDLGTIGNYSAKFDWFYLDYQFRDWLGVRAGRTKTPFGLYNEVNDIDAARVPILLPQSVYPTTSRDFLLALTGIELYGRAPLSAAGALEYRVYAGTLFLETFNRPSTPSQVDKIDTPYVVGGRLLWETPLEGLRAGGSVQALRLDADLFYKPEVVAGLKMMGAAPDDFRGLASIELPAILWVASVEYALSDLLLAAEYGRWHVKLRSTVPALLPESDTTSERLYGMASYRVRWWFTPGLYYSLYFPNVEKRDGSRERHQHDIALTLRFDINDYWLIKVEGHFMRGTALLNSGLNDNKKLSELDRDWALLLAKTTVYF